MTALLLIAGVIIFAMVVAGVWLMHYAEAASAARAVGRAPDPAEEDEAWEASSTPRSSFLRDPKRTYKDVPDRVEHVARCVLTPTTTREYREPGGRS
jgi:hypothetical protein